jgi:hypothetical protein
MAGSDGGPVAGAAATVGRPAISPSRKAISPGMVVDGGSPGMLPPDGPPGPGRSGGPGPPTPEGEEGFGTELDGSLPPRVWSSAPTFGMLGGLGSASVETFARAGAVADAKLGSTPFKASPTTPGTGGGGVAEVPELLWGGAGDDDADGALFGGWGGFGSDAPAGAALSDAGGRAGGSDAVAATGFDAATDGTDGTDGTAGTAGTATRAAAAAPATCPAGAGAAPPVFGTGGSATGAVAGGAAAIAAAAPFVGSEMLAPPGCASVMDPFAASAWPGTRSAIDRVVSASAPASVRRFGSPGPSRIRLHRYVPTPTDVPNPHQCDPLLGEVTACYHARDIAHAGVAAGKAQVQL